MTTPAGGARKHAFPMDVAAGRRRGGKAALMLDHMARLHRDGHRVLVFDVCANGAACPMTGSSFATVLREWTPDGIAEPKLCDYCERHQ